MSKLAKKADKLDKRSIKQHVLNDGYITIDEDGACIFAVVQINDENFSDISPMLKQQLEDEGKSNSWIGFVTSRKQMPYSVQMLPIYGNPKKYVTKWFTDTAEEAIDQCLSDRQMVLLKRASSYIES